MKRFAVLVKGSGCLLKVREYDLDVEVRVWLRQSEFRATRYVEAASTTEAAEQAIMRVQKELRRAMPKHLERIGNVWADAVWEDPVGFARYAPGYRFIWFPEDSSGDDVHPITM